jgi:hypothetical protein
LVLVSHPSRPSELRSSSLFANEQACSLIAPPDRIRSLLPTLDERHALDARLHLLSAG